MIDKGMNAGITCWVAESFADTDSRRSICGVMDIGVEFEIVDQIKIIQVLDGQVVGNHGHFRESGQVELICVVALDSGAQCSFVGRDLSGGLVSCQLHIGSCVLVAPGCALSVRASGGGVTLIEQSNQSYNPANYFKDVLQ